jgi:alanine racemase
MKEKKSPLSYIQISKKDLIHNVKQFRNLVRKGTKLIAVIKGDAYGHGQNIVAKILEPYVDYFQIDNIEELRLLRKITKKKILVFGYVQEEDLSEAIELVCTIGIFSINQLKALDRIAGLQKKVQPIHIAVDAHLGREGFMPAELSGVLNKAKNLKNIKITGIYAHFANIEDTPNFSHAQKQINKYREMLDLAEKFGLKNIDKHISSTSGILVYEKNIGANPLVRLGIGVYGMWPSEYMGILYKNKITLKPILTWKTKVAQIKILPPDHTVGYGLTYKTKRETKIALIPQGYADGVDRGLSNKGEFLIGGERCKILGRVSMNMTVVDISNLSDVKQGDEVVIIGKQDRERITAEEIAEKINTINYEVTTRISSLLPRVIV